MRVRLDELPFSADEIFPPGDYALHMRIRRGDIGGFWRNRGEAGMLEERRRCVDEAPTKALFTAEGAEGLVAEAAELGASIGVQGITALSSIGDLAVRWEPDLLYDHFLAASV